MSKLQGWSFWLYVTLVMWAAIIFGIASIAGCDERQLERADRIVSDANDLVTTGQVIMDSPAGQFLPPDIRLYGTVGLALASLGVNGWQKVRSVLMTKTTKAIVKGIEAADKPKSNPMSAVKSSIKAEMEHAGVYDKGNQLVDRLKLAR